MFDLFFNPLITEEPSLKVFFLLSWVNKQERTEKILLCIPLRRLKVWILSLSDIKVAAVDQSTNKF